MAISLNLNSAHYYISRNLSISQFIIRWLFGLIIYDTIEVTYVLNAPTVYIVYGKLSQPFHIFGII